jgi:hypothetical protein
MGAQPSREAEISQRLVDALESGHMHTLQLLLKFIQHVEGGSPIARLAAAKESPSTRLPNGTAASAVSSAPIESGIPLTTTAKPARPALPTIQNLTEEQSAFHARAASLAQKQALDAGLQSASFPILVDLDAMKLTSGETILTAAVTKDQPAVVKLLCETGLEIDAVDMRGLTALHHAALLQRLGCASMLLQAHAFTLIHSTSGLLASQMTTKEELRRKIEAQEVEDQIALLEGLLSCNMVSNPIDHALFTSTASADFPLHLYRMECAREMTAMYSPTLSTGMLTTEVWFRGPAVRSTSDCIQMYYVDDPTHPEIMRPRVGSFVYLTERRLGSRPVIPPSFRAGAPISSPSSPSSSSPTNPVLAMGWDQINISLKLNGLTANSPKLSYRFVYYDAARQQVMAATNVFTVTVEHEAPALARKSSVATSSTSSSVFSFIPALLTPTSWVTPSAADASNAPNSPTPVALHPSFHLLSDPSPENIQHFSQPPPAYFRSYFTLNAAACTLALQLDPRLSSFKADFVPKQMTEKEFWIRYYFGMARLNDSDIAQYPKVEGRAPAEATPHSLLAPTGADVPAAVAAVSPANGATTFTHADSPPSSPIAAAPSIARVASPPAAPAIPPAVVPPAAAPSPAPAVSAPEAAPKKSTVLPPTPQAPVAISAATIARSQQMARPPINPGARAAILSPDDDDGDDGSYVPPSFAALPAITGAETKQ